MSESKIVLDWVGFDLDDTLHYFRKASGAAMEMIYKLLAEETGVSATKWRLVYEDILREAQGRGFEQNKSSREYRSERFNELLSRFKGWDTGLLDLMLDEYDRHLAYNLELRPGALEMLQYCKDLGLKIMVVTEGPTDAQETTLKRLGVWEYVDLLVTSADEQMSKPEGLVKVALDKVNCDPKQFIYLGDNFARDVFPLQQENISAILVNEKHQADLYEIHNDQAYYTKQAQGLNEVLEAFRKMNISPPTPPSAPVTPDPAPEPVPQS